MSDEGKYEKIEQYLSGNLSESDRQAFERQLTSDPDLKAEVNLHQELAEAFDESDVVELEHTLKKIASQQESVRAPISIRRWIAIAAGILLMVTIGGLLFFFPSTDQNPVELYQAYLDLPDDLLFNSSFRTSGDIPNSLDDNPFGKDFFEFYKAGNYKAALSSLEEISREDSTILTQVPSTFHYFRGITLLQLTRPGDALDAFQSVQSGEFTENALWYSALCLLRLEGKSANTKAALDDIVESNHPQSSMAQEILDKLF